MPSERASNTIRYCTHCLEWYSRLLTRVCRIESHKTYRRMCSVYSLSQWSANVQLHHWAFVAVVAGAWNSAHFATSQLHNHLLCKPTSRKYLPRLFYPHAAILAHATLAQWLWQSDRSELNRSEAELIWNIISVQCSYRVYFFHFRSFREVYGTTKRACTYMF